MMRRRAPGPATTHQLTTGAVRTPGTGQTRGLWVMSWSISCSISWVHGLCVKCHDDAKYKAQAQVTCDVGHDGMATSESFLFH